jgi:hypothetical protein
MAIASYDKNSKPYPGALVAATLIWQTQYALRNYVALYFGGASGNG